MANKAGVLTLGLSVFLAIGSASADEYFEPGRNDRQVPAHCAEPMLKQFSPKFGTFIYGIDGSKSVGFTHEYPIAREEASYLWMVFLGQKQQDPKTLTEIRKNPRLQAAFDVLMSVAPAMGYTFDREGDVLEALASKDLEKQYAPSEYFVTGGISYHDSAATNTIGELDLVVARRSDCGIVAIGEAKLGNKQLGHARQQLERFRLFLRQKCHQTNVCQS